MREVILNQSLKLFLKHGFKTVTMDVIAKELGMSKKTIYQHFSSKHQLVHSVIEFMYNSIFERLQEVVENSKSPIHEFFDMRNCIDDFCETKVGAMDMYQFNKDYPKLSDYIKKRKEEDYQYTFVRNLQEGIKRGYYREDIDVEFVSRILLSISNSVYHDESFLLLHKTLSLDEIEWKISDYHLRAIVTEKGLRIYEQLKKEKYQ